MWKSLLIKLFFLTGIFTGIAKGQNIWIGYKNLFSRSVLEVLKKLQNRVTLILFHTLNKHTNKLTINILIVYLNC